MPRPLQVAAAGDVLRPSGNRSISPEPASPPDDVLTVQETADLLRVDVEDVQTLITSGELPARRLGDQWRLSRTAVLAWLGTSNS
ncbi:MAG: helix-turn-helix domain-containing protein [Mycobacterium sp.]|nr:helix-turn-helix domain-containing protein [Mycobacterium sp.]